MLLTKTYTIKLRPFVAKKVILACLGFDPTLERSRVMISIHGRVTRDG